MSEWLKIETEERLGDMAGLGGEGLSNNWE